MQASQVKLSLENSTAKNLAVFAQFKAGLFVSEGFKKAHGKLVAELEHFVSKTLKAPEALEFYDFFPTEGLEKVVLVVLPEDLQKVSAEYPYASIGGKLGKHLLGFKKAEVKVIFPEDKAFVNHAESFLRACFWGFIARPCTRKIRTTA